jgi:hypothetical protein
VSDREVMICVNLTQREANSVDATQAGSLCYTNFPEGGAMSEKHPPQAPRTQRHQADGLMYHRLPARVRPWGMICVNLTQREANSVDATQAGSLCYATLTFRRVERFLKSTRRMAPRINGIRRTG